MAEFGKRYVCKVCGTEVLCTKAGTGTPRCDDQELVSVTSKVESDQSD